MDRCALFVDAGYLLADGAMAVHGTRNRDSVSWDYAGLARLLEEVARDRTGLPLLRCYWYEATADGRRTQEQDGIADIPGIKFRAARIRPGRREGVESYVQRDLTTLARTGILCEAVLVSGDEDMAQVVADVQDMGVRVTVVHVSVEGNWTISRSLRRECDDLIEIGAGHLRPYVTLLSGAGTGETSAAETTAPLSNGRSRSAPETERHPVEAHPASSRVEPAAQQSGGMEAVLAATGSHQAMGGSAMDQLRAMRQTLDRQRGGDQLAPQTGPDAPRQNTSGPIDANGFPTGPRASHAAPPRQEPPAPPPAAPATGPQPAMGHQHGTGPQPAMGGYQHGTGPQPAMGHQHGTGPQPGMGAQGPMGAQPGTGPHPSAPAHPGTGPQPPAHPGPAAGPGRAGHGDPAGHAGHTGQQPSFAPDGYGTPQQRPAPPQPSYEREAPPGAAPPDPRYGPTTGENPGYGGNTGPNPIFGASTEADSPQGSGTGGPHGPPGGGTGPRPRPRVQHGPYTDPTPSADFARAGASVARTIEDAVNVARQEGNDFAESIARDAPVLWLEAVLVRRPRMPSDLEARLLQGSALPIDFLLRDEVREALRQGFWEALERHRE
ncbi:NYN domain-containing protein [Nocardiopsis suaedae]|uniref:NYN domain-containing protein n=1 Tax=Nocardiopsis suaedae TaxID=3018444 RepID=A0ABT4TF45_9ACTN|nr:NYN domain-containing protein [Nocardiopsis suaedae]MDA2803335.1 NYN domain-containing protein [Nocardiopsis suaedae]